MQQQDGIASAIVTKLNAAPQKIEQELEAYLKKQPSVAGAGAGQVYLGGRLNKIFDQAMTEAAQLKDEYISAEHVLVAMSEEKEGQAGKTLRQNAVTRDAIFKALVDIRGNQRVTDPNPEGKYQALERYARDFNELARKGSFDPVIGRDEEIRRVMQILTRRTKNNPVLIGEPGVGKTAIVEGIARRYGWHSHWVQAALAELLERGLVLSGRLTGSAPAVQWCDRQVLERLHRETLAALQRITRLIVGREVSDHVHLVVDVDSFKQKRELALRRLAQRLADQAVETARTVVLEPMPPQERRIVHLTLRADPRVTTESVGEGDRRKVTIIPVR